MKFGAVPVAQAEGGVAVHSIRQSGLVLKKGTLIGKPEIAALQAAGIAEIVVARIEPGDVSEDAAAGEIAAAVAGAGVRVDHAFTGRANLFAESAGVLVVDKDAIDRLNQVDESITFATLAGLQARGRGRDDRHGQDHSVRRHGKGARCRGHGRQRGPPAGAGRAVSHSQGRRRLHRPAGPRHQGHRKDLEGHRRAPAARRAPVSSPSDAYRTSRRRLRRRSRRCWARAPSSSWCSARPPSPTGATSSPPP